LALEHLYRRAVLFANVYVVPPHPPYPPSIVAINSRVVVCINKSGGATVWNGLYQNVNL